MKVGADTTFRKLFLTIGRDPNDAWWRMDQGTALSFVKSLHFGIVQPKYERNGKYKTDDGSFTVFWNVLMSLLLGLSILQ